MRNPDLHATWVESRLIASRLARMQAELRALARIIEGAGTLPLDAEHEIGGEDRARNVTPAPEPPDPALVPV